MLKRSAVQALKQRKETLNLVIAMKQVVQRNFRSPERSMVTMAMFTVVLGKMLN